MHDIRRHFLQTSVEDLEQIITLVQNQESAAHNYRLLFRRLHTIKGTAQTFGLNESANLAHKLESLLDLKEKQFESSFPFKDLLLEGLNLLIISLQNPEYEIPAQYLEKIRDQAPVDEEIEGVFLSQIPPGVYDQLTEYEKSRIATALKDNNNLYCLDVIFDLSRFADDLRRLQEILKKDNEILFTLPGENTDLQNQIGFQIFISSAASAKSLENLIKDFNVKLILQTSTTGFNDDLAGILSQIVSQGKALGNKLGKQTKISILSDEPDLTTETEKLIFDILLHLVRNAIVHTNQESVVVEVRIVEENGHLKITVFNDGAGVDLNKVKTKAIEKNLILPDTHLSEEEILEFIFLPGFSTAENLTEIAGRGIGLDAVRDLVINTGGTISIENQANEGTTFEIFLPIV